MAGTKEEEGADKGGKEEVPLVPVGDGAEDLTQSAKGGGQDDDRESDRQAAAGGGGGEEDRGGGDERMGGGREEEDDDRRDLRDMTQREKRDRRRRARDRDRTELRYLRHRNEQLEREASENAKRLDRLEEGRVEDKLTRLRSALKNADSTIIRLASVGEEAQAVEAQSLKSNLEAQLRAEEQRLADMKATKGGGEERADREAQPAERRQMPAEVRRNLERWYDRNPWFDAESPDSDSQVAMALDKAIQAEGYDPRDPEYYEELDRRIADYMPHISRRSSRSRDDDRGREREDDRDDRIRDRDRDREDRDDRRERRGRERDRDRDRGEDRRNGGGGGRETRGPVFRVGGRDRPLRENEVYLSAERRKALEEMGAIDDPILRNRYLKAFKKYDEANPPRRDR